MYQFVHCSRMSDLNMQELPRFSCRHRQGKARCGCSHYAECIIRGDETTKLLISSEQGERLAESYGLSFFEVSAKNGTGVHEAFTHLGKTILDARWASQSHQLPPLIRTLTRSRPNESKETEGLTFNLL